MNYLLSVDGGGTKTEFCVSSIQGEVIKKISTGSSNYKSVGVENTYNHFKEGLEKIKESLSIDIQDIAYSVWGISGCDSENECEKIQGIIEQLGIEKKKIHVCNDGVLAFYAQAEEPGIVIISGTGSIVIGIGQDGTVKRCGGWGYNISDTGSGHWIGNEAIKQTLLYCDGCSEYSPLFDEVREYFQAESFSDLPYIITEITDYYEIAKVAHLIVDLSAKDDLKAKGILKKGAGVLGKMAGQVYRKLEFHKIEELNIVLSGGVFKSEEYQRIFKKELGKEISLKNVKFTFQVNPPSYGGIKLARKILAKGEENVK